MGVLPGISVDADKRKLLLELSNQRLRCLVHSCIAMLKDTRSVTAAKFLQTIFIIKIVQ